VVKGYGIAGKGINRRADYSEIGPLPVLPEGGMIALFRPETGDCGHLPAAVDGIRGAIVAVSGYGEVGHRSVLPQEGMTGSVRCGVISDDLAGGVDGIGGAGSSPKRAEVGHRSVLPEEGVRGPVRCG